MPPPTRARGESLRYYQQASDGEPSRASSDERDDDAGSLTQDGRVVALAPTCPTNTPYDSTLKICIGPCDITDFDFSPIPGSTYCQLVGACSAFGLKNQSGALVNGTTDCVRDYVSNSSPIACTASNAVNSQGGLCYPRCAGTYNTAFFEFPGLCFRGACDSDGLFSESNDPFCARPEPERPWGNVSCPDNYGFDYGFCHKHV